jgi:hypothetical protein
MVPLTPDMPYPPGSNPKDIQDKGPVDLRADLDAAAKKILSSVGKPNKQKETPWFLICTRTISIERPPLVGEFNANFCR